MKITITEHDMAPSHVALYESNDFDAFKGKTLEQKVQEIADREEIKELMSRYGLRVIQGKSLADMYVEEGHFVTRGEGKFSSETRGRKAIEALHAGVDQRFGDRPLFMPMFDNYVIKIMGDEAISLNSVDLQYVLAGKSAVGAGYYENRFRREDGRWKFVKRDATFVYFTGD